VLSYICVAITCAVLGIIYWAGINSVFARFSPTEQTAQVEPDRQHIQPQLVIDSVKAGIITNYHLSVENIGNVSIRDVSVSFSSSPVRSLGMANMMLPVTATLPPRGGRVSVPGADPVELSKRRAIFAIFTFRAKANDAMASFVSSNYFVLSGPLTQRSIDPQTFYEITGDISQSLGAVLNESMLFSFSDALARLPHGTIEFQAIERNPDGSPNHIAFITGRLSIVYNPVERLAVFIPLVKGQILKLRFEPADRHYLAFAWDERGPQLVSVDGKFATRGPSQ